MDFAYLQQRMATHADLISRLVADVSDDQAQWKPDPERWSILEVVNHLYDEEREDFREHLDMILHRPGDPWSPIRPFEWVTEREYNTRDLAASIDGFLTERRASLAWLEGLVAPDWDASIQAPWDARMRAGDMLASWAVHDQWHIQQLVRLRRDYTIAQATPYEVEYAGTL
ncbi:MAG: DinB family protein [Anaerolineae bacterium]